MSQRQDWLHDGSVCIKHNKSVMEILRDLASKDQTEVFYLFDVDEVVKKVHQWRLLLPQVTMFYAVKCNSYKPLLEILAALNVNFDCSSIGEVEMVRDLVSSPSDSIILANTCKRISPLHRLRDLGVSLMTFDSSSELHKIKLHYPAARLVLRIRYDDPEAQSIFGDKFGVDPGEAKSLLDEAWALDLQVVGVSFHVGTGATQPSVYYNAIEASSKVFDDARTSGFQPYLLDIGGGFPGNNDQLMQDIAQHVNSAISTFFPEQDIKVIAEPGRYVATASFTLTTTVTGRKDHKNEKGQITSIKYITDDSVFISFKHFFMIYTLSHPRPLKAENGSEVECDVWGDSCAPMDVLVKCVALPNDLRLGDRLVWFNMGAYTLSMASEFCGFPLPHVYRVFSKDTWADIGTRLKLLYQRQRGPRSREERKLITETSHTDQIFAKLTV